MRDIVPVNMFKFTVTKGRCQKHPGVVELHSEWGGDNIVSLGLGGVTNFSRAVLLVWGGTLLSKKFCTLHA